MKRVLLALWLLASPAGAQVMMPELTGDYGRGFCDAVKIMMRNRDHYRLLSHFPAETMDEFIKRIYEAWPPKAPKGYEDDMNVRLQLLEMAGIDLYVMVPPQLCEGK